MRAVPRISLIQSGHSFEVSKRFAQSNPGRSIRISSPHPSITGQVVQDDPWVEVRFGETLSLTRRITIFWYLHAAHWPCLRSNSDAKAEGRCGLFNLLSPRYLQVEFFTQAVITELQVGFGSKEFNNLLRVRDYCHR
jgi:hypothetical protein